MKISRSKKIEILVALTIIVFIFIYSFIFSKEKKSDDQIYVYNDEKIEEKKESDTKQEEIKNEDLEDKPVIIYDDMTLEQLSEKLNRSLNSDVSGYGNLIASYSLEKGVDPYLATGIMLHETGCTWNCSNLVKSCNNVGGMKGTGCGSYGYFSSLEEGIQKFIDNIYKNYYAYGLTTADLMGSKYAEDPGWSRKVNAHIEKIKNR